MVHSYSPNGFIEDNSRGHRCLCGVLHISTGARILSLLHFLGIIILITGNFYVNGVGTIGQFISSIALIVYAAVVTVGVFGEKRLLLLPFLIVQAITAILLLIAALIYGVAGIISDSIAYAHTNSPVIRDLYKVHDLDPDNQKTRAVFSCGLLLALVLLGSLNAYVFIVFRRAYIYFKQKEDMIGPSGYQRGKVIANNVADDNLTAL
uniref:MARVEL domain-containing protein n=1 Tax=Panagrellus redivivus TaxID=6233 RepID=A0A7E4VLN1_PANRE